MELCRIILVDDHSLFRSGMRGLLDRYDGIRVVGEASTGEEFLAMLPATEADVVFMDFAMPGMNGAETTEKALALEPGLKVITLSMFGDENYYSRMVQAGAKGFLMKDSPMDEVLRAIETVAAGGTYFCEEVLRSLASRMQTAVSGYEDPTSAFRPGRSRFWSACAAGCRTRRSPTNCSFRSARWTSTGPIFWRRPDVKIRRAWWFMPSDTAWWMCCKSDVGRSAAIISMKTGLLSGFFRISDVKILEIAFD